MLFRFYRHLLATEVILRRSSTAGVSVSIVPTEKRTEVERQSMLAFHGSITALDDLPVLIDQAKEAMGLADLANAFAEDVLRVEVSGPDRPHLTIVDLPGFIHAETKQQKASDVDLVKQMVRPYMENRRSIILAVVSAKNDYANQIVLKMAWDVDIRGHRTLGIITKLIRSLLGPRASRHSQIWRGIKTSNSALDGKSFETGTMSTGTPRRQNGLRLRQSSSQ
jgi:hypothetical protein